MDILDLFPIGTIVEFVNDTDPNVVYGGTWEKDNSESILVCQNNATFSGALGTFVGNNTATAGYPAHSHATTCRGIVATTGTGGTWGAFNANGTLQKKIPNGGTNHPEYYGGGGFTASNIGGGGSHENRMRSLQVRRWIRVSEIQDNPGLDDPGIITGELG